MKNDEKKGSLIRFFSGFQYALNGIAYLLQTQRNAWVHFSAALLVLVLGFWLGLSPAEWLFIFFAIGLVISAELFNTAIEELTDIAEPEKNQQAGRVKDLAAGGVLVAAITAAIIGLIIFLPHLIDFFKSI
jgi:diacylglycerol kinase